MDLLLKNRKFEPPQKKKYPKCGGAWNSEGFRSRIILTIHGLHKFRHLWGKKYEGRLWVEKLLTDLFTEAMSNAEQTPILELPSYLKTRKKMIRYAKFRERNLFIGSGAIESGNRYAIQNRLKRSGMRWTIPGANAIANLSASYMSNRWDELWRF